MKFSTISALFTTATALGVSAQSLSFLDPHPNQPIQVGKLFTANIAFEKGTSNTEVEVLSLFVGAKVDNQNINDLGHTKLAVVQAPTFPQRGPIITQQVQSVPLVFPSASFDGVSRTYNLTVGAFYTVGPQNTPGTATAQIPILITAPSN